MTDPTHRHGHDPDDLMAWRQAQPPANGWAEVEALRLVVRALHDRVVHGGPSNYNAPNVIDDYLDTLEQQDAYWRAMNK